MDLQRCTDCHVVLRLLSMITGSLEVGRDRNRFHRGLLMMPR
uniref:Uncharacterized protein n=1 Tax=Arundo donax TaxID=35708 RepID=A0A0A9AH06_ARUDO